MKNNTKASISAIAIPIILALLTSVIMLVITGNPASTLFEGVIGIFENVDNLDALLKIYLAPLIFTGVAVAFAFRGGLFNIGAEGQFMFGGVFGVFCALSVQNSMSPVLTFITALVAGMLGGAIIGFIPGLLKAVFKVNEVVICIMMNYVAFNLSNYLVRISGSEPGGKNTQTLTVKPDVSSLINPFGNNLLRVDLLLAILTLVIFYIVIKKTVFGYELRASGLSAGASNYAGMNVTRNVILTMTLSGAIAGLGGVLFLFTPISVFANVQPGFLGYGFSGIAVALLGLSTPLGVFLAAILFAILGQSGKVIATLYVPQISSQISSIMTSFIVFFISFQSSIKKAILTRMNLREANAKEGGDK